MLRIAVDGVVDGEDQIEDEDGHQNEVKEGIPTRVMTEALRCGHRLSFRVGGGIS